MFSRCFDAVRQTVGGRPLSQSERDALRNQFSSIVAQGNPTASETQMMAQAIERMRAERKAAALRSERLKLQMELAHQRNKTAIDNMPKVTTRNQGVNRLLTTYQDARSGVNNVVSLTRAIYDMHGKRALSQLNEAMGNDLMGFRQSAEAAARVVDAAYGRAVEGPIGKAWAAFAKANEYLRLRANAAGANIGKLPFWLPQHWSGDLIAAGWKQHAKAAELANASGPEQIRASAEVFADKFTRHADRNLMRNQDGTLMNDAEIWNTAYESARTLMGMKRSEAAAVGVGGSVANRGSQHRVLHIGTPEGYKELMSEYSGVPLIEALNDHVQSMARNIAMMETLGPNPVRAVERLTTENSNAAKAIDNPKQVTAEAVEGHKARTLIKALANANERPEAKHWATKALQKINQAQTFKLFGAFIPNFFDKFSQHFQAMVTGRSNLMLLEQQVKLFGGRGSEQARAWLTKTGIENEVLTGAIYSSLKDVADRGYIAAAADAGMRLSLMTRLVNAQKEASRLTIANSFGRILRKHATLADATEIDARIMRGIGFTEQEFAILREAKQERVGEFAEHIMTLDSIAEIPDAKIAAIIGDSRPEAIAKARDAAGERYFSALQSETSMAVIEADPGVQNLLRGTLERDTFLSEMAVSAAKFKSFPVAVIVNNMERARFYADHFGGWTSGAYVAGALATLTVAGYGIIAARNLRDGKNMPDVTDPRMPLRAALAGGAFGLYGDLLTLGSTSGGMSNSLSTLVGGPVLQDVGKALGMVARPIYKAFSVETDEAEWQKEADRFARDTVTLVRDYVPGTRLWYLKAAIDHTIMHNAQEALSPGYLGRLERKAENIDGVSYWWQPGEAVPDRMPGVGVD